MELGGADVVDRGMALRDSRNEIEDIELVEPQKLSIEEEGTAESVLIKYESEEETQKCGNLVEDIENVKAENTDPAIKEITNYSLLEEEKTLIGLSGDDGIVVDEEVKKTDPAMEATGVEEDSSRDTSEDRNHVEMISQAKEEASQTEEGNGAPINEHLVTSKVEESEKQADAKTNEEIEDWSNFTDANGAGEETVESEQHFDQIKKVEIADFDIIRGNNSIKISEVATEGIDTADETTDKETNKQENQNSSSPEKDEASDILKRNSDDFEEQGPNAKIPKLESDSEPEPEITEPEPENLEHEPDNPKPENVDETASQSHVNTDLISKILQNPMTSRWESQSHKPYELHTVSSNTIEYITVKAIFDRTRHYRMTLREIQRVENPYLLGMYLMKKEKMERSGYVDERDLFHGTKKSNLDGICRFNFDWRRKGESRGHRFGQGVSFSPKASYAHHYNFDNHVMILARVLVSQIKEGNCNTVIPPEPYDSTRNHSGDVIVKYSDDDFYPQYIIYYNYKSNESDDIFFDEYYEDDDL